MFEPPRIDLSEAMATTRAVRRHRPDPIPDAVLRRVLEAATYLHSGSSTVPAPLGRIAYLDRFGGGLP